MNVKQDAKFFAFSNYYARNLAKKAIFFFSSPEPRIAIQFYNYTNDLKFKFGITWLLLPLIYTAHDRYIRHWHLKNLFLNRITKVLAITKSYLVKMKAVWNCK